MKKNNILFWGLKEINNMEKGLISIIILSSIIDSVFPFVNLVFLSLIIKPISHYYNIIIFFVIINSILSYLQKKTSVILDYKQSELFYKEKIKTSTSLFSNSYVTLIDEQYRKNKEKYFENLKRSGSTLYRLCCQLKNISTGLLMMFISLFLFTINIKKLLKTQYNQTQIFYIFVVLVILCVIITAIIINLNKSKFKLIDKLLENDQNISYYFDIVNDKDIEKEIKIYSLNEFVNEKINYFISRGIKIKNKIFKNSCISASGIALIGNIVSIITYLSLTLIFINSKAVASQIVLLTGILLQIVPSMIYIIDGIGKINITLRTLPYYKKILTNKNYNKQSINHNILNNKKGNFLEFNNVNFRYPNAEEYTLKDINLTVNKNETIAVVGQNGSGKTTLIKLLCGFYDDYEGTIKIQNSEVRFLSKEFLKTIITAVFQDFRLFSVKIGQNISAEEIYSEKRIKKLLNETEIDINKIPLDIYINQDIDDNGIKLSGGQNQKIAILRSLYKKSQIVILDEPTASLDPISENNLYKQYQKIFNNKTGIFISHRLASCSFCDRIVVIDKGTIVQEGTQKELLEDKNGLYYKMWKAQSENY